MSDDAPEKRRGVAAWLAGAGAIAAALAALIWLGGGGDPPPPAVTPMEAPPVVEAPAPAPVQAAVSRPPPSAPPPGDPPEDPIAAYRARTRLAPTSGALSPEAVDLLEPNRRYEKPLPIEVTRDRGPDGIVTVLLEADQYAYTGDETVSLALHVKRGGAQLPITIQRARAVPTGIAEDEAEEQEERLTFLVRDGVPRAELELGESFAEHHGTIDVIVDFEWEPGASEQATLRIATQPVGLEPAFFTGRNLDHADTGSLVVEVGIDVIEPGFYRLDANLFDATGAPLAHGHFKGDLEAGESRVPIEFFGLLLRELGVSGPYELRNLRGYLFREAEHPDKLRMRDANDSYWTRPYSVASLSDQEYTSAHKEHMLELLEADLAAGRNLDLPDLAE